MNPTARRLCSHHMRLALAAYYKGDNVMGDHHMSCALTYAAPIGNLIASTYN